MGRHLGEPLDRLGIRFDRQGLDHILKPCRRQPQCRSLALSRTPNSGDRSASTNGLIGPWMSWSLAKPSLTTGKVGTSSRGTTGGMGAMGTWICGAGRQNLRRCRHPAQGQRPTPNTIQPGRAITAPHSTRSPIRPSKPPRVPPPSPFSTSFFRPQAFPVRGLGVSSNSAAASGPLSSLARISNSPDASKSRIPVSSFLDASGVPCTPSSTGAGWDGRLDLFGRPVDHHRKNHRSDRQGLSGPDGGLLNAAWR